MTRMGSVSQAMIMGLDARTSRGWFGTHLEVDDHGVELKISICAQKDVRKHDKKIAHA